eukprot:scaffold100889_cov75-Phaeocystis_antarctica.AAC.2
MAVAKVVRLAVVVVAAVRLLVLRCAQVTRINLAVAVNVEAPQHRRRRRRPRLAPQNVGGRGLGLGLGLGLGMGLGLGVGIGVGVRVRVRGGAMCWHKGPVRGVAREVAKAAAPVGVAAPHCVAEALTPSVGVAQVSRSKARGVGCVDAEVGNCLVGAAGNALVEANVPRQFTHEEWREDHAARLGARAVPARVAWCEDSSAVRHDEATQRPRFLPPRDDAKMLCRCMSSMRLDSPMPYAPPPSPMHEPLAPSSLVCHEGQCAPESHEASGAQSQADVTRYRLFGPSPAETATCIAMLLERFPFAEISLSSEPLTMNRPWSDGKATDPPKSSAIRW